METLAAKQIVNSLNSKISWEINFKKITNKIEFLQINSF